MHFLNTLCTIGFNIDALGNSKKKTLCGGLVTIFLGLFGLMFVVSNFEKIRDPDFSTFSMSETAVNLEDVGEVDLEDTHVKLFFVYGKENSSDPIFLKDGVERYLDL